MSLTSKQEHELLMFSKTTCPFCSQAKELLKSTGQKFVVVELDELPPAEAAAMQDSFEEMTGARTVPRVRPFDSQKRSVFRCFSCCSEGFGVGGGLETGPFQAR